MTTNTTNTTTIATTIAQLDAIIASARAEIDAAQTAAELQSIAEQLCSVQYKGRSAAAAERLQTAQQTAQQSAADAAAAEQSAAAAELSGNLFAAAAVCAAAADPSKLAHKGTSQSRRAEPRRAAADYMPVAAVTAGKKAAADLTKQLAAIMQYDVLTAAERTDLQQPRIRWYSLFAALFAAHNTYTTREICELMQIPQITKQYNAAAQSVYERRNIGSTYKRRDIYAAMRAALQSCSTLHRGADKAICTYDADAGIWHSMQSASADAEHSSRADAAEQLQPMPQSALARIRRRASKR